MTDILMDYIRWRGDLSFEQVPFSIVDNLILCELCYLDLSCLYEQEWQPMTFREACSRIKELGAYQLRTAEGGQEDFIYAAAHSRRFGELCVLDYVDQFQQDHTQFSAVQYKLDKNQIFLAYRGTDASIIGWKEDFMMSFTSVPAQKLALEYLETTFDRRRKYLLGGHSKGANLAVYAAAMCSERVRFGIDHVYMNDGPGFAKEVFDTEKIDRILPMVTRVLPTYDVVGQLFAKNTIVQDTRIVHSSNRGILQHDLVSWCVDGPSLALADGLDPSCALINNTFAVWIENLDPKERALFVRDFFDALSAGGARTFDEVLQGGFESVIEVLKAMNEVSPSARQTALALPKTALLEGSRMAQEFLSQLKERIMRQGNGKTEEMGE